MKDHTVCPVCHRSFIYLAAHLWVAHGERVVLVLL